MRGVACDSTHIKKITQEYFEHYDKTFYNLEGMNKFTERHKLLESNLQIQCNPYQATNGIFHRTRTNNFTICMETQKTSNSQSNLEKEE